MIIANTVFSITKSWFPFRLHSKSLNEHGMGRLTIYQTAWTIPHGMTIDVIQMNNDDLTEFGKIIYLVREEPTKEFLC